MNKRISRTSQSLGRASLSGAEAVPLNIVGPIRKFWDFTKKTAKAFAKNFKNPEEKEAEFINIVRRDADKWS